MNIFEAIELAKNSDFGLVWYSEKGPIQISKDGFLTPLDFGDLPTYPLTEANLNKCASCSNFYYRNPDGTYPPLAKPICNCLIKKCEKTLDLLDKCLQLAKSMEKDLNDLEKR